MAIVLSLIAITHFTVFMGAMYFYFLISNKYKYIKKDHILLVLSLMFATTIGLVGTNILNHFTNQDQITLMGMSAFPIFSIVFCLFSYVIINFINLKKEKLKYYPVFSAGLMSGPVILLFNSLLYPYFAKFL